MTQMMTLGASKAFHNIRGQLKVASVDFGVQSTLVKRHNGKFVMLEAVEMDTPIKAQVDEMTENGELVDSILMLHPFHTMFVEWAHKAFPKAKLYGSDRHISKFPQLPWEPLRVNSKETWDLYKDDLAFSVPKGVDFISPNEAVHFSSVLAFHPDSGSLHVSDTFVYIPMPKIAEAMGVQQGAVGLHPSLPLALERRAGAADDLREWVHDINAHWQIRNLCAAHSGNLLEEENTGKNINMRIAQALNYSETVLTAHDALFGKRAAA